MLDVIVAVNITVWPNADGFGEDVNVMTLLARTNSSTGADVLPLLLESQGRRP